MIRQGFDKPEDFAADARHPDPSRKQVRVNYQWLTNASITAPAGWSAGAIYAGIKTYGDDPRLDLGMLVSDAPCAVAGLFTTNKVQGAPVAVSKARVQRGTARALIVNSGCSNVAMGERGRHDALRMTELAAKRLGLHSEDVLVGSTGVIGRPLPMDRIEDGIGRMELTRDGGPAFSRAIMTTDTVQKSRAVRFELDGCVFTVAGTAKGAGMSHPNMATVFCFLTTDAWVRPAWLQEALKRVGDESINMVDVDMDTSTSDMMLAFANGATSRKDLADSREGAAALEGALREVSIALAKDLARDGEGATSMIEATVRGARNLEEARLAARTVVSSPLIKSMVTGRDPNLGRVLMALGRSGAELDLDRASVWIGEHQAFARGAPTELNHELIRREMAAETVRLTADLGVGTAEAVAWGCNLTEDYVRINADYTT